MARELKPHGTNAAYRRHLRAGESACEECLAGERERKARKRDAERAKLVEVPRVAQTVDALEEALDNLAIVKAAMHSADVPIQTIPALSKRRDELVDRVKSLQAQCDPVEVSIIDELTSRRNKRRSNSAG